MMSARGAALVIRVNDHLVRFTHFGFSSATLSTGLSSPPQKGQLVRITAEDTAW
jgi:hypothetical protein